MRISETIGEYNSLITILDLVDSKEPKPLTVTLLDSIMAALSLGKIECENREEGIKCLEILSEMGVISLEKKKEETGTSFLIGNLYNGK